MRKRRSEPWLLREEKPERRYPNYGFTFTDIYDPKTRLVFHRDWDSWGKLGIFYLIFYLGLAALMALCFFVFFNTLDPRIPRYSAGTSIIDLTPGLGFRPMPFDNVESTLVHFNGSNATSYLPWFKAAEKFLRPYYKPGSLFNSNSPPKTCTYYDPPARGQACRVNVDDWKDHCSPDEIFNYHRNSPCLFIKLNRIYGWVPEYYDDPYNLPYDMPQQLKWHIGNKTHADERKIVWVSCEGENPADVEFLGHLEYYPKDHQGFPGYYFPYLHEEGYLSPLVAVRFTRPLPGIVINIECRAWAKNIKYSRLHRTGSVHFELWLD